jgi:hypothetical protein
MIAIPYFQFDRTALCTYRFMVIFGIRQFACVILAISLLAGAMPRMDCKAAACAQAVECASMRCCCQCDGAKTQNKSQQNKSQQNKSQGDSHEAQSKPDSYCPMIGASGISMVSPAKQIEMPALAINGFQPFIAVPVVNFFPQRMLESKTSPPTTLLSMGCALTI